MSWIWSTVYLPPNVVDVQVVDIDKDGIQEIVVAAKASLETVPAPITLFVYEKKSEGWAKRHVIPLGTTPIFWSGYHGLWGLKENGVVNLITKETIVEDTTWLNGLQSTSPKRGNFVFDYGFDGELDFVLHGPTGVDIWNQRGELVLSSVQPMEGSIREYNKTGGVQVEIAQRGRPLVIQDFDADGTQDLIWLRQQAAQIHSNGNQRKIDLPINVEPQYAERPKRQISWIDWVDVNGDQQVDLLWQYWINGANWFGGSAEIGVALGSDNGFLEPTLIREQRAVMNMQLHDIDGDGDTEIWSTGVEMGITALSRTLLSQTANARIQVYGMSIDGPESSPKSTLNVSIPIGQEDAFDYKVVSDQNGDGVADLLLQIGQKISLWHSTNSTWTQFKEKTIEHRGSFAINCRDECDDSVIVIWNEGENLATVIEGL